MTKAITRSATVTKQSRPRFKFIGETINELKKVVWLSRREVIYLSVLVLLVAGIVGLVLAGLDYGFTRLIDELLLRR